HTHVHQHKYTHTHTHTHTRTHTHKHTFISTNTHTHTHTHTYKLTHTNTAGPSWRTKLCHSMSFHLYLFFHLLFHSLCATASLLSPRVLYFLFSISLSLSPC